MLRTNSEVIVFEKIVYLPVRFFCFQKKTWKEALSFSFQNSAAIFVPRCVQPSHNFLRSLILDLGSKRSERRKKDLKMWIPVITLAALLGHTSGQFHISEQNSWKIYSIYMI